MIARLMWFVAGGGVCALSLNVQEVHIRWAVFRYGVDERILRAVLRAENGPKGFEGGMNNVQATSPYSGDLAGYVDPTMPDGALQHGRLSRRIVRHVQRWVFTHPKRRDEWLWDFAHDYHGASKGPTGKDWLGTTDKAYYATLARVWSEERKAKGRAFAPFTAP
jgi:hypothetical protein